MRHLWKKGKPAMAKALLAAALTAGSLLLPTEAGYAESARTIRVALFADIGSKYKLTVPAVTLQSGQAWSLTGGGTVLVTVPAGSRVRASLDGYRVKVLETASWQTAAAAAEKLQSTSDKPLLFLNTKGGGNVYQLYTGTYASESAAKNAADRVAKAGLGLPADQIPVVKGGKHLTAGSYATSQEADTARATIAAAGVDAWTAVVPSEGGGSRYEIWVAEAANDSDLAAAKLVLSQALPQLMLAEAPAGLMIRTDAGLEFGVETQGAHYAVSGGAKFTAAGSGAGIQLAERSKRTYRGNLELGDSNGSLSVVNEVPLEQYLYSVVGAEVPSSWPEEALKAQAVAARSYALAQGTRFDIANVVDTTLSQVYNGTGSEADSIRSAVDATAGEVLKNGGGIIEAVFSSNSGGKTADPSEVWNNGGDVFASVDSSGDASAAASAKKWYYVQLPGGADGYVREDNVKLTGDRTEAGLELLTATTKDVNVRPLPSVDSSAGTVGKLNPGDEAVVLDKVLESGSYSWIKGPYTSSELLKSLQGKTSGTLPSSIVNLEVTQRGPSGRAVQISANGNALSVKYPDLYRSAMGGLPSTLFDIVPSGSYTVLGADGRTATVSGSQQAGVLSASGMVTSGGSGTVVMNGDSKARVIDATAGFLFIGRGNGHGLGMSQWGVKGLADQGNGYRGILEHYFQNVTIVKE